MFDIRDSNGRVSVTDEGGLPLSRAEAQAIRDACQRYLDSHTDADIEASLRDTVAKCYPGMYEQMFGDVLPRKYRIHSTTKDKTYCPRPGYVYMMHGDSTEWYKVGVSVNPTIRRKNLDTKSPFKVSLVAEYYTEDMLAEESKWHTLFAHVRTNGEWFQLSPGDLSQFIDTCSPKVPS